MKNLPSLRRRALAHMRSALALLDEAEDFLAPRAFAIGA